MKQKHEKRWANQLRTAVQEYIDREMISVTELARRANIPQRTLALFVSSENAPTLDNAQRLAESIGFTFIHKADSK